MLYRIFFGKACVHQPLKTVSMLQIALTLHSFSPPTHLSARRPSAEIDRLSWIHMAEGHCGNS